MQSRPARWMSYYFILICQLVSGRAAAVDQPVRPNVVVILCDDMGWSDIGCYGGEIDTPNLDRLARDGMRFTAFYNNAKCTTTRASLVTGLYPRPQGGLLKTNMVTLGEVMSAAGYQTALCGKWHLGRDATNHPLDRGFDEFYGLLDGCCNFFNPARPDPAYKGGRIRFFADNRHRVTEFPDGFYTTDAFTDRAIDVVQRFAAAEQPFLLHLCYTAPHYPLHAKPADIAKYVGRYRDGWESLRRERFARQQQMGLAEPDWELSATDSQAYAWSTADQEFEGLRMAVYAAMVDAMDQNIGRLRTTIERLGIADNTLILFLSDNGGCAEEPGGRDPTARRPGPEDDYVAVGPAWGWAQNTPFRRYKQWVHEGGIATPLIACWPGKIEAGVLTRQVGHIIDILPTCLELAGAEYPQVYQGHEIVPVEGRSLVPILRGESREPHRELAWQWSGNAAIRQGPWKLVWDRKIKRWELYNLEADRTETRDLATAEPQHVQELVAAYHAWAHRTGHPQVDAM